MRIIIFLVMILAFLTGLLIGLQRESRALNGWEECLARGDK